MAKRQTELDRKYWEAQGKINNLLVENSQLRVERDALKKLIDRSIENTNKCFDIIHRLTERLK